ncbi:hypothetical protein [Kocuria flava]|uniref:hypothetical protein n=1 Tax=Kocuria flava TaxID=446860 RepID=UPI002F91F6F6
MGLTRAQKARKHGDSAGRAPGGGRERAREQAPARPAPPRSSPGLVVGATMAVAAALWLWVHAWILPGFAAAAAGGTPLAEWTLGGFDQEHARALAASLDEEGRAAYEGIHRSSGLLAPLFVGLAWLLFVALNTASRARRWTRSAVVLAFAGVSLAGNSAIDAALADPGDGAAVTTASVLVLARWVLLVLLLAVTALTAAEGLRRRASARVAGGDRAGDAPLPRPRGQEPGARTGR